MSKHFKVEILDSALAEHDAVVTWNSLHSQESVPDRISVLYREEKTQVYCLHGLGPGGSNVIAKRCERDTALIERSLYETILSELPVSVLGYYGFADDGSDEAFSWLFLEDAGKQPFLPDLEEHRVLAGRWLGMLHGSACSIPAAESLPDRGPAHFLKALRESRDHMNAGISNPVLTRDDVDLLKTMIVQFDLLERHWPEVASFCQGMPQTLIHGDLVSKNARIRAQLGKNVLLVMDWEFAGWGVPALDLTQFGWGSRTLGPDLGSYLSAVQKKWPALAAEDVHRLAHFGRLFRIIATIEWATRSLLTPWLDDEMVDLRKFQRRLRDFIELEGWL